MPTLHVALHDGFSNDLVVLRVGQQEVARREGVSTRYQIGLAATIDLEVEQPEVDLEVEVPTKGLSAATHVDVPATPYVGVSIEAGRLVLQPQGEPFRYA